MGGNGNLSTTVRCPAHTDNNASLQLNGKDDGAIVPHCFAGCDCKQVAAAIKDRYGVDCWEDGEPVERRWSCTTLKSGERSKPIHFRRDNPDGRKKTILWEPAGTKSKSVIYLAKDSTAAKQFVITEGEPAADACAKAMNGTTEVFGTVCGAKCTPDRDLLERLVRRHNYELAVLWPDNDTPGQAHMRNIADVLSQINPEMEIRFVKPPEGSREKFDAADCSSNKQIRDLVAESQVPSKRPKIEWLEQEARSGQQVTREGLEAVALVFDQALELAQADLGIASWAGYTSPQPAVIPAEDLVDVYTELVEVDASDQARATRRSVTNILSDVMSALIKHQVEIGLFRHHEKGLWRRESNEKGWRNALQRVETHSHAFSLTSRAIDFKKERKGAGGNIDSLQSRLPREIEIRVATDAEDFSGGIRPLGPNPFTFTPMVNADGEMIYKPDDYDEEHRTLHFYRDGEYEMLPGDIDGELVTAAKNYIDCALSGFWFEQPCHKAAAISMLMSAALRASLPDIIPFFQVLSAHQGTGKTGLCKIAAKLASGVDGGIVQTISPRKGVVGENEFEWALASAFDKGRTIIILDNFNKGMDSSTLASLITGEPPLRQVGEGVPVPKPPKTMFMLNAAGASVATDLYRRTIPIRLMGAENANRNKFTWRLNAVFTGGPNCHESIKRLWTALCCIYCHHLQSDGGQGESDVLSDFGEWQEGICGAVKSVWGVNPAQAQVIEWAVGDQGLQPLLAYMYEDIQASEFGGGAWTPSEMQDAMRSDKYAGELDVLFPAAELPGLRAWRQADVSQIFRGLQLALKDRSGGEYTLPSKPQMSRRNGVRVRLYTIFKHQAA